MSFLDEISIASPCPAKWEDMTGDARVRFCGQCRLNVYDISQLSRDQAEDLITRTEGNVCVRLCRRADGKVLTRDCPVGLAAFKRRVALAAAALTAVLSAGLGLILGLRNAETPSTCEKPLKAIDRDPEPRFVAGRISLPPPRPRLQPATTPTTNDDGN